MINRYVASIAVCLTCLAGTLDVTAQQPTQPFALQKAADLYDERGFNQAKALTVDGKLMVNNHSGNVSYSYPISTMNISGAQISTTLNYCGSVGFTTFTEYVHGPAVGPKYWEKFTQNRPAWILGVNEFAVQVIATTGGSYISHPDYVNMLNNPHDRSKYFQDDDLTWVIDGYDFCNRMDVYETNEGPEYKDRIQLLRADGSLLTLSHVLDVVEYPSATYVRQREDAFTGYYVPYEANAKGFGVVEYDTLGLMPQYMWWTSMQEDTWPRRLRYYPGDGLEYVFTERVAPYGMRAYTNTGGNLYAGGPPASPTIFYLEEIRNSSGLLSSFFRSRHYKHGYDAIPSSFVPDQQDDSTRGRALMLQYAGHQMGYGTNMMVVEALGRTTKIWFDTVARSGYATASDAMPLNAYGYWNRASKILATVGEGAEWLYKSYVGYVTKIQDAEGRITTFDYEKYTRVYEDFKVPYDTSHVTLKNYRLTDVVEPTQRYEICYVTDSDSLNIQCDDTTTPSSIKPSSLTLFRKYALSNYAYQVKKYSHDNTLLTTDVYDYALQNGFWCGVSTTDHITGKQRRSSYLYVTKELTLVDDYLPPIHHTMILAAVDSADGIRTLRQTGYDTLTQTNYVWLPTRDSVFVNGIYKTSTLYSYALDTVRRFGWMTDLTALFGWEPTRRFARSFAGSTELRRDTTEYLNLALVNDSATWVEKRLLKFKSLDSFYYYQTVVKDPRVVGKRWEDVMHHPPVAQWKWDTLTDRMDDPPIYGLVRREWASDAQGRYLGGIGSRYVDTVPLPLFTGFRGNRLADTVFGRARASSHVSRQIDYMQGWGNNLPIRTRTANGAKSEQLYTYAEQIAGYNGDSLHIAEPTAARLADDDSIDHVPFVLHDWTGYFYSKPMLERNVVRRYLTNGTVDSTVLRNRNEYTYYGLQSATIEPNGWLSRYAYDKNGRLDAAWLPLDFPPTRQPSDTTAYDGTYGLNLAASTMYFRQKKWLACGVSGTRLDTVIVDTLTDVLFAEHPVSITPGCPCDPPSTAKGGAQLMATCNQWVPYVNHLDQLGYLGILDLVRDSTDLIAAATQLDSLWLRLLITEIVGECVTLEVNVPTLNFSAVYLFNCTGTPSGDTIVGDPQELFVDLTPIKGDIQQLSHGEIARIELKMSSVGHKMAFARGIDADDTRPTVLAKGRFRYIPDLQDYTVAFTHDDANLEVVESSKVDDLKHTASAYAQGQYQTLETRKNETRHRYSYDGNVVASHFLIGNPANPDRIDSITKAYTGLSQLRSVTDQNGNTIASTVEPSGRVSKTVNADGTMTFEEIRVGLPASFGLSNSEYYGWCMSKTSIDENGSTVKQYYDARDHLRQVTVDSGGGSHAMSITKYQYDELGRLTHVTDPRMAVTRYWYDALGRVQYKYHPSLDTVSYAYDNVGNVRFVQSQQQAFDSLLTFTQYDDLNRVTIVGEAKVGPVYGGGGGNQGAPVTGDWAERRGREGKISRPSLFGAGDDTLDLNRLTDQINPNILNDGNQSTVLTANKTLWSTPQSLVPTFWNQAQLDSVADNCGMEASGMLGETSPPQAPYLRHPIGYHQPRTAPAASMTEFEDASRYPHFVRIVVNYDSLPARAGAVWSNFPAYAQWDSLAPRKRIRNMKGRQVAVAYREHGGHPFHYVVMSYDERGRVEAQLRYTENLGFDGVYYSYNSMNQVTSVRTVDPIHQHTTWYGYNFNGQVDSVWTKLAPGSGFGVAQPTLGIHSLPNRNSPDIAYSYNKIGAVSTMDYPLIWTKTDYHYNNRNWLDSLDVIQGPFTPTRLFVERLTYDSTGQILKQSWEHAGGGAQEQRYEYDSLDRLVAWAASTGDSLTYGYDQVGNRTNSFKSGSMPYTEQYKYETPNLHPDRLLERERDEVDVRRWTTYTYDADGAVVTRQKKDSLKGPPYNVSYSPVETFAYSWRDLLWKYEFNGPTHNWRYRYSAAGEREQKRLYPIDTASLAGSDGHAWVYYLLGADKDQLAVWHGREEYLTDCPTWTTSRAYLYPFEYNTVAGGSARVSIAPVGGLGLKTYRIADHLGSNRIYIDANGVVRAADYEPFGRPISGAGADMRQTFVDNECDVESGLGDFGVRKYDVDNGRFLSADPEWERGRSWSPYVYTEANPTVVTDRDGRWGWFLPHLDKFLKFVERQGPAIQRNSSVAARWISTQAQRLLNGARGLADNMLTSTARGGYVNRVHEIAKAGGQHARTYKDYYSKPLKEVQSAYKSYVKNVFEHLNKLRDPEKYAERWATMSPNERAGTISVWVKHLKKNADQAELMRGIIEERTKK